MQRILIVLFAVAGTALSDISSSCITRKFYGRSGGPDCYIEYYCDSTTRYDGCAQYGNSVNYGQMPHTILVFSRAVVLHAWRLEAERTYTGKLRRQSTVASLPNLSCHEDLEKAAASSAGPVRSPNPWTSTPNLILAV
ncbi:hypothetical protein CERZMDRAFT_88946 [Cercospora zeae-maydis SCOH1-5]|uniref:Uncharacterized protein n=1 Tax=Cercospora zeae-maydis SCOH1-5 TaxID=717836 RepID=A0A6A6EYS1_9PEZI|nr:hypothetical protein CERZMDRAFT_88945 [Cercospora zeae-maydis SCOH1-5]KAF2206855.1 hypothetical protein CERZMDRAFT_88946 [Cercospora zeae-maydis SCOH1-5]